MPLNLSTLVSLDDPGSSIEQNVDRIVANLEEFVECNIDPADSENFVSEEPDPMEILEALLQHEQRVQEDEKYTLALLKSLKILSRKQVNRQEFSTNMFEAFGKILNEPMSMQIAAETCSVLLNVCYEKDNVDVVLAAGIAPALLQLLSSDDEDARVNAAGALQSISYQEIGREFLRDIGAIPVVVPLLTSPSERLRTRAVGVVHNISTDAASIQLIRRENGIIPLIDLLRAPQIEICVAAAGSLQNISRETASQEVIKANNGIPPLTDLVFGNDIRAQVCASGALLNLLGPDCGNARDRAQRNAFKRILTMSFTLGMIFHGMYSPDDDSDDVNNYDNNNNNNQQ